MRKKGMKNKIGNAFTLIELLVVIAIISILASLHLPPMNPGDTSMDPFTASMYTGSIQCHNCGTAAVTGNPYAATGLGLLVTNGYLPADAPPCQGSKTGSNLFNCPVSTEKYRGSAWCTPEWLANYCLYVYVGGSQYTPNYVWQNGKRCRMSDNPRCAIMYEATEVNIHGSGMNALFLDGHARLVIPDYFWWVNGLSSWAVELGDK
jgi:prepilin-type N-terminal cleavage/methylation domain-containing protein/prepilin-type processing-associated H-X9-DG protein